jgi:hypothetical protein
MSYRFKRRAFLASLGGAIGLETMLKNLEAAELGTPSPPRLLAAHWPVGTIQYHYLPAGGTRDFTMSRILMPFETAGLRDDLAILFGLTHGMATINGGGHEGGTVVMMTGASSTATRANGGEADDSIANGPSFDQIFLKHVPALATLGKGYANATADARVDSYETSTQCLSYSHLTREVQAARPEGSTIENVPLMPTLHPIDLYTELFDGFVPGNGEREQMLTDLRLKKSVLDGSLRQLARLGQLAPASERLKIDVHTEAIRKLEMQLSELIENPGGCEPPPAPDAGIEGKIGGRENHYSNPVVAEADAGLVEQVGKLHLATIRTAFQCDLIRVATFQWVPGQTHMSIAGLDPTDPDTNYVHHPMSHREQNPDFHFGPPPSTSEYIYEILVNANTWYFQKYADVFAEWKTATDAFGGSLLDHTVIPLMTEVDNGAHSRNRLPALILGGKALGMRGGQLLDFQNDPRFHNDLWMTVAQAFFPDSPNVLEEMPGEVFARDGVRTIEGLWQRPV